MPAWFAPSKRYEHSFDSDASLAPERDLEPHLKDDPISPVTASTRASSKDLTDRASSKDHPSADQLADESEEPLSPLSPFSPATPCHKRLVGCFESI